MSEEKVELKRVEPRQEIDRDRRGYSRALGYPDPQAYEYGYGADPGYGEETQGSSKEVLQKLWRAVRRRKWPILAVTLILTAVVAIEVIRVRPSYTASAVVEIRGPSGFSAMGGPLEDPDSLVNINTKILMFDSRQLLEDVVVSLNLDRNERFRDVSVKRPRLETLKNLLKGTAPREQTQETPPRSDLASIPANIKTQTQKAANNALIENPRFDRFVSILEGGKSVQPIKETQALRVSFTHTDPYVARDVANGLAQSFVQRNLQNKTERFANKTNWLDRSTGELKAKVADAEQRLAAHSREHNIFSTQGETVVTPNRLAQLHDQAVRAEMGLVLKQFMYDEVRAGRGAQLPEAFTDVRINELQKRLNDLSVQAAQLSVNYGPEHPSVNELQQQMAKLQEQLDSSTARLEEKIKTDYALAYRETQALRAAVEQAKSEAVNQDQAAVQNNLLKQDVATARTLYNEFLSKAHQTDLEVAQQTSNMNIIRPARVPRSTDGLNKVMSIVVGFLVILGASVGVAFCLELLDKSVKNVGDVARYGQLPTLGVIPSMSHKNAAAQLQNGKGRLTRLLPATSNGSANGSADNSAHPGNHSFRFLRYIPPPRRATAGDTSGLSDRVIFLGERSAIAEAYRGLRTSVLFATGASAPKTILITSGEPGEGKTTTVINTAISLAQLGSSVLIIDADLRKPMTHKGFGLSSDRGLSTYLSTEGELDGLIQRVGIRNLSVLPCGPIPVNPAELINSERMKELLRTLSERFDHIVIDSPPLMHVTDPAILSTMVNGVILVVRGGKSSRDTVRQSRQMLANVGANIFGVVLNNVSLGDQSYADFPSYNYDLADTRHQDEARISNILG